MTLLQNGLFYTAKPTIPARDMNHSSVRYELFHHAIWALSGGKTGRFAKRIKTGCNTAVRKRLYYRELPILSKFTFFGPNSPSVRSDAFFPHFHDEYLTLATGFSVFLYIRHSTARKVMRTTWLTVHRGMTHTARPARNAPLPLISA